jgi:hypothetical protein
MGRDDVSEGQVTLTQGLKYGLGFIGAGVGVFLLLSLMEGAGRGARVHWLIAALYYIGGKWTVAGIFWLGGLGFIVAGVRSYLRDRE